MSAPDLEQSLDAFLKSAVLPAQPDQQTEEYIPSPEFRDFAEAFGAAPAEDRAAALARINDALPNDRPFGAARLAIFCGAVAEGGGDASLTADGVVRQFRQQLDAVCAAAARIPEGGGGGDTPLADRPTTTPEEAEAVRAMSFVAQSVVSHLARLPDLRAALAADAALGEQLDTAAGHVHGAEWVGGVLRFRSGDLLVLHPPTGRGFRVAYRNLGNAFHLFTLLQGLLGPDLGVDVAGRADVLAMARGDAPVYGDAGDSAAWEFCHYLAAATGGGGGGSVMNWMWGEMSPADVPRVDGTAVLLLYPARTSRSWNAGFFAPQIQQFPAAVDLTAELPPAEAAEWLARVRAAADAGRGQGT